MKLKTLSGLIGCVMAVSVSAAYADGLQERAGHVESVCVDKRTLACVKSRAAFDHEVRVSVAETETSKIATNRLDIEALLIENIDLQERLAALEYLANNN